MPTTRKLEIPGDSNVSLTFHHTAGELVATASTTRGRQVVLDVDDLRELEEAVANAIGAIVNALTTTDDDESGGAPDQRGALDDPQLAV